jgi:putative addiction module killer protein
MDVRLLGEFATWLSALRDQRAKAKILIRLRRLSLGNPGDIKPIGEGVSELRVHEGPGYRIYLLLQGEDLAIVLLGGTKSTQAADIAAARALARRWRTERHGS